MSKDLDTDDHIPSCKVVLVGESGVGKTCINNRFILEKFTSNELATTSASYSNKILEFEEFQEKKIQFNIWDTAGEERFRSIGKIFYKDANAVILVYDITNEQSFEAIKNYWYFQVMEFCPKNASKSLFKLL